VDLPDLGTVTPTNTSITNYRVIRQPQPIDGETTVTLPANTAIDFSNPGWNNNGAGRLSTPPAAPSVTDASGNLIYDVLFSPSGQVIGQNTPSGMIYLWVRRAGVNNNRVEPDNSGDPLAGKPIIVTITVRMGSVAQHPVNKADPFAFTRDGKSSGM